MDRRARSQVEVARSLEAYVPPYVRWRLTREPSAAPGPFQDLYSAAVIHADLTGFTALAEQFAAQGVAGAEHVCDTLGLFFQELGAIVAAHHGHTLSFAGDAATAMWPVSDLAKLPDAVRCAMRCCRALDTRLSGRTLRDGSSRLRIHLSVGAGEVRAAAVGGVEGRWLPTVYGDAFDQVCRAQHHASSGQILASPEAWSLVQPDVDGERLADGTVRVTGVRGGAVETEAPARQQPLDDASKIRPYVPRSVQARLEEGAVEWLAEFRHATVAFIHFLVPLPLGADDQAALHRFVEPVQTAVSAAGGGVNKVLAEHDGFTIVAAWGLPLHAHEDNAVRAIRAALAAERCLQAVGLEVSVGIATGRIYMGQAGTSEHKEYALLGDVVNIAARLAHLGPPGIRCDGSTRLDARSRLAFETLRPTRLRGRTDPVAVYRPLTEKAYRRDRNVLIGRDAEREVLHRLLGLLEAGGPGNVIVIEGEPGIGKSRLATDLLAQAQHRPVQSLVGWGEPLERATPYHAWRDIFAGLLGLDAVGDRNSQRARVLEALETPERQSKVALTNVVLPFDFPETAETLALRPAARARATREVLVYLFARVTAALPTVVVLEDAHWMDSSSWALAHDLTDIEGRHLFVVVARPVLADQMCLDWRKLRDAESTIRIRLEALAADDALTLACLRLDVDSLPAEVADRILQTAEGHPFFTEQLVLAMRDKDRVIRIEAGECRVVQPLSTINFAETVHALVDSRIDGLSLQQQDTLKVAAVLGRRFDLWSLRATHPGNPDTSDLQKQLDTLVDLELLRVIDGPTGRTYSFKHAITQEAVSGWLLPSERRNLNARVARMLEDRHPADLTPVHALLAHHWREAGVMSKALDYLELAASRALKEDANQEAVQFIEQALEYGHGAGVGEAAIRVAVWKRHFAEASWVMGDTARAKQYVAEAMLELHRRPRSPGVELAVQVLVRGAQSVFPRALIESRDPVRRQHLIEMSRVAAISAILHSDPLDHVAALAGGLLSHNLAERSRSANVYALGMLAYGAGMLKLRRIARAYFARMRHEAHAQNELRPLLFGLLLESMHLFSDGHVKASERCLAEGLDWAGGGGNQRDRARLLILLGAVTCYSGRMRHGLRAVQEAYDLARYEKQAALERSWSLITLAGAYSQHLPAEEAIEVFGELRERIQESLRRDTMADGVTRNHLRVATAAALDALVYARAGRVEHAVTAACEATMFLGSIRNMVAVHPATWILIQGPFEAFWRGGDHASQGRPDLVARIEAEAQRFARILSRFAYLHPIYRPRALLFQGEVERRRGRLARARAAWARSLVMTEALAAAQGDADDTFFMFDRALALSALGSRARDGVDRQQLDRALALFAKCEMPCYEREVRSVIESGRPIRAVRP